jgi:translocator assembly and maintenance protein 41
VIKYGVISSERLAEDLTSWDSLYVGGRLHKPVLTLVEDADIAAAAVTNCSSALRAALLLLPSAFSTEVPKRVLYYS